MRRALRDLGKGRRGELPNLQSGGEETQQGDSCELLKEVCGEG